ncbi:MAG: hypothetical protein HOO67_04340 [Candidatus Peribacteraceae bacterium]|nr:hypothetical protein [Candidatus Peribacteraceae bacterium]
MSDNETQSGKTGNEQVKSQQEIPGVDSAAVDTSLAKQNLAIGFVLTEKTTTIPPNMRVKIEADIQPLINSLKNILKARSAGQLRNEVVAEFLLQCEDCNPAFMDECKSIILLTAQSELDSNRLLRIYCNAFTRHICMPKDEYIDVPVIGKNLVSVFRRATLMQEWKHHESPYGNDVWETDIVWTEFESKNTSAARSWEEFIFMNKKAILEKFQNLVCRIEKKENGFAERLHAVQQGDVIHLLSLFERLMREEEIEHAYDNSYMKNVSLAQGGSGFIHRESSFLSLHTGQDPVLNRQWSRFDGQSIAQGIISMAVAEISGKAGSCIRIMRGMIEQGQFDEAYAVFLLFAEEAEHYRQLYSQPGATLSMTNVKEAYVISALRIFSKMGISDTSATGIITGCESHSGHPVVGAFEYLQKSYETLILPHSTRVKILEGMRKKS